MLDVYGAGGASEPTSTDIPEDGRARLIDAVRARLTKLQLDDHDVVVTVTSSRVTLTGSVSALERKLAIGQACSDVDGVAQVVNEIAVVPGTGSG